MRIVAAGGLLGRLAAAALAGTLAACAAGDPPVALSPHVDGLRHGLWRIVHPEGFVEEGSYVAGRLHGEWVLRDPAGAVVTREHWCHGRPVDADAADCD